MPDTRAKDEGRLRIHRRFPTRYLSTPRDIAVYLPPGYDSADFRCPVFYLQDGQNLFDPATAFGGRDWRADLTADHLIRTGAIPPVILVGVYNAGVRRISEYTPTREPHIRKAGKGDRYAGMLARELKAFIDGGYRTLRGPADTAAGGSSLGGLVSLEAGLLFPRIFGKLAILSPSVWWDNRAIVAMVQAYQQPARARIWLDTGTAEGDNSGQVVADARVLRDALAAKGWQEGGDLCYREIEGAGHNEDAWAARFGDVLQFLFST